MKLVIKMTKEYRCSLCGLKREIDDTKFMTTKCHRCGGHLEEVNDE